MELRERAKTLSEAERCKIIMDYDETDLHKYLKELFHAMEPDYLVEITHGAREFGKDLLIVKADKFSEDIIGVVVKRGHIRGKTLGDVDNLKHRVETPLSGAEKSKLQEIESQVEQALIHPAKTRSIIRDLKVSKVFVILAGEFSNQAQTRLTSELATKAKIFDIHWLVKEFTEFYPQIFYEGRAIDFLERKISELEENHRLGNSGKNLSEYFVNPLVMTLSDPINFDEENLTVILKEKKLSFLSLEKICKNMRKLILLGDPGSGKTGSMAKLTIEMYRKACNLLLRKPGKVKEDVPIPVFVPAKMLLGATSEHEFLNGYFKSEEVQNQFKVDIIIVDGLDEVASEERANTISKLDHFSEKLGASYILTSRKIDIINTLPQKYQKYELLPLEFKQALQLFSKLITDHKVLGTMKEGLEKIRAQIPLVPLSLMLLIELVEEHKEIPASVTELYDRFFDMALGREDYQERGITVLFDYVIKKKFLGALAYNVFVKNNTLEITDQDFRAFLTSYASQYGWSAKTLDDFTLEIERAGILDQREKVHFKHRSFLDYFAAFHIYENRGDIADLNKLIVETYFDDIWSEISFFYIGLRREISRELLETIYSYKDDGFTIDLYKLLSGRLLQAGWHSTSEQHEYGIRQAIRYALEIQKRLENMIISAESNIPKILSDFLTLILAEWSFNSGFLESHVKSILRELIDAESHENTYMAVILIGTIRRFLSKDEVEEYISGVLEGLSKLKSPEQQARILLLMGLIEEDKSIMKLIKRQTNRLQKKAPDVFKALLPAKRKGFR